MPNINRSEASSNRSGSQRRNLLNAIAHRVNDQNNSQNSNAVLAAIRRLNRSSLEQRAQELGMTVSTVHAAINQVTIPTDEEQAQLGASEGELNAIASHIHTLFTQSREQVPAAIWNAAVNANNDPSALVNALLHYERS